MSALSNFYYESAQKALNEIGMIPPAPHSSPCASGGAQDTTKESAESPYLADWALDTRETYRLTDVELVNKMRWELEALKKRERLQRMLEVPTIYPEVK